MITPDIDVDKQDDLTILDIIVSLRDQPGALLPILHKLQNHLGFIPESAIPLIADTLNLSRADVHGVVSFYHHFRSRKPGTHVIQICCAESCQSMGAGALERYVKQVLGINYHQTTEDKQFTLEPVYCLGNCACSPSMSVADKVYGEMDILKFDQLYDSLLYSSKKVGVS